MNRSGRGERLPSIWRTVRIPAVSRTVIITGAFVTAELGVWIAVTATAFRFGGVDEASKALFGQLLPATVAALFVGHAIARWGTTRVLVVGSALQSMGVTLAAVSLSTGGGRLWFYAGAVVASTCVVTVRPAVTAALPGLVDSPDELVAANVVIAWMTASAALVGPLIVALTVSSGNGAVPLWIFAGCTAVAAAVASTLPISGRGRTRLDAGDVEPREQVAADLRGALRSGTPMLAVMALATSGLVVGCADLLYVVIGQDVLGGNDSTVGWLGTAGGVGALAGGAAAVVLIGRHLLWPPMLAAGLVSAGGLALVGLSGDLRVAALMFGLVQLGATLSMVASRTLLQRLTDTDVLGHMAALAEAAEMAMLLLGALLVPAMVRLLGAEGAGVGAGATVMLLMGCSVWLLARLEAGFVVPIKTLETLRRCRLIELLPAPALETLARAAITERVSAGELLFEEGVEGDRYYVVVTGEVDLTSGRESIGVRGPGEGFGELALLHPVGRTATATARSDAELLSIDRATFLLAVTGHAETMGRADKVTREWVQRLLRPPSSDPPA